MSRNAVFGLKNFRYTKKKKLDRFYIAALLGVFIVLCGLLDLGFCSREDKLIRMKVGGIFDFKGNLNSAEIVNLARFAFQELNKKQNVALEFARVLKAKEQVVAGMIYYLTIEVGNKKKYEAKIWVKPWMNFKHLQELNTSMCA